MNDQQGKHTNESPNSHNCRNCLSLPRQLFILTSLSFLFYKREHFKRKKKLIIDKIFVTWLPLGMFTLCVFSFPVSPSLLPHLLLSDSISLFYPPSILSSSHHHASNASGENPGSFGQFNDNHFTTRKGNTLIPLCD